MAANFFLSSHANYHLHPREALLAARVDDLRHATDEELAWVEIWSGSVIQKLCKRLSLRQKVIATAIVYFRRFYLRNSYCETDPALVAATCCYVAGKSEETPVHVKSVVAEARGLFSEMGITTFPSDNTRIAEMEFYLLEELDFHLIIFHPYRSLVQLCGRDGGPEAGGTEGQEQRLKMLQMDDTALQMAWFVINDTFRSSLSLIHPPHLIALAAIYLAFSMHPPEPSAPAVPSPRKSSRVDIAAGEKNPGGQTDAITFLASLNVELPLILEIVQEIISLYELWNRLDSAAALPVITSGKGGSKARTTTTEADEKVVGILVRMRSDRKASSRAASEAGSGSGPSNRSK